MSKNVFVAYDLDNAPQERYEAVRQTIELCATHGYSWLQDSLAYIKTEMSIEGITARVRLEMLPTDRLAVIHAVNANVSPLSDDHLSVLKREFQTT